MQKGVIILGSSNSKGDTYKVSAYLSSATNFEIIDLKTKNIAPFDYEFKNQDDDFLTLIKKIVHDYEMRIFATPVYWYNMSGTMKIFFDRISDCLKIEKETDRKLRGMKMGVLTCASDKNLPLGFHMPFIESAKYLGMTYIGDVHCWVDGSHNIPEDVKNGLDDYAQLISAFA